MREKGSFSVAVVVWEVQYFQAKEMKKKHIHVTLNSIN